MSKKKNIKELLEEALVPKDEQRFHTPVNWVWTWTGTVAEVRSGGTPKSTAKEYYDNGTIPWITPADLSKYQSMYISKGNRNITLLGLNKSSAKMLPVDTVLLSSRAPIGYVAIAAEELCTNQGFKSFVPSNAYYPKYLYWYLKASKLYLESMASGSTFKELSGVKCRKIPVPLPPMNEQKRIVKKLERLLNKIEEAKQLIDDAKETFEFRRSAILDKAFRGELSAQWREDNFVVEDAFSLLERIQTKKRNSSIKSNTLKINSVTKEEEPFDLPEGWAWIRLGEISYYVTSGSRDWSKYYSSEGAMFIRTQDINKNSLNFNDIAFVSLPEKVEGKRSLVENSDILTTITGANVGKCALVETDIKEAYVSQSVALTKLIEKSIAKYVHLSLLSPCGGGKELEKRAYGIGRPVLSLEDIKNIKIPLAPIGEQQFIVNMVEKLLANETESLRLASMEKQLEILKQSILNKAFRGELGTNNLNEESSMGLLKKIIQEKTK
ncbi:restriction endonuclease [Bacillus toyonensis]|uniref:restriction endonuclease subunit S n=1 Tax=Bacillus toyonensis TaxID=155322 RepID=UPI000BF06D78|nr:restriction endonuclease subunit S [Bacillus toyonensis]PEM82906.1 restriction endonuclease [Bacillus toyonensis]PFY80031.1 restriction endonuclease [Bacillus toyonensis]